MKTNDHFRYSIKCPSPVGVWTVLSDGEALVGVYLAGQRHLPQIPQGLPTNDVCKKAARQLAEYFAGKRCEFDLPLAPQGTEFQERVWNTLRKIPYGATWSYGQLARHIGAPDAARAVGAANGQNPIAVIIPCHRVIGTSGKHVGYAGGLGVKAWLLAHEAPLMRPTRRRGEQLLPLVGAEKK
jgi:methylated-DNA-[protein]-cysteine S-methyltransferase